MINFRYHLVSLIAVFIALAIGIILGAGPLQARIARSVTPAETGAINVDTEALAQAEVLISAEKAGLDHLASRLSAGSLKGIPVVTVALPGTDGADIASARDALSQAGATMAGAVTLTDNWDIQGMEQYRQTLSTPLSSHTVRQIPADATSDAVIAYAIVDVLTTTGAERDIAAEILTDATTPIMTLDEDPKGTAQAVVVIGPRNSVPKNIATDENIPVRSSSAWMGLARAIAVAPRGGVLVGDASHAQSMLSQIRSLNVPVTTVDQVGTSSANLAMVLALPTANEQARSYGVGEGASEVFPPIDKLK